jgi:hypothetical protein
LIFVITPADRGAVFVDNSLWECGRGELEPRLGTRNDAIDNVFSTGEGLFSDDSSHSMLCLPLVSRGNVIGALYAESVDGDTHSIKSTVSC